MRWVNEWIDGREAKHLAVKLPPIVRLRCYIIKFYITSFWCDGAIRRSRKKQSISRLSAVQNIIVELFFCLLKESQFVSQCSSTACQAAAWYLNFFAFCLCFDVKENYCWVWISRVVDVRKNNNVHADSSSLILIFLDNYWHSSLTWRKTERINDLEIMFAADFTVIR